MNANGITAKNKYVEWEMLIQSMDDAQIDTFCINETNIDMRQSEVQFKIRDIVKQKDRHIGINMSSSRQTPATRHSIYKPGGMMVGARGQWSGRIIKSKIDEGRDNLGRWTITHLKGKEGTTISIMSIYQVCKDGDQGKNTAYMQQQADFFEKYKCLVNPRQQLCKDVKKTVKSLIDKGHKVIICADINDDAGEEYDNEWNRMLADLGMRNIHQHTHKNHPLP